MSEIPYNHTVIGTCAKCGGPVTVPMVWHGINEPPKQCQRCGSFAAENYGPVLPMEDNPVITGFYVQKDTEGTDTCEK